MNDCEQQRKVQSYGVVVIGRNEGERLLHCLDALEALNAKIIYVDSASKDASVSMALAKGIDVIELNESAPLNAARARNAGYVALIESAPQIEFVQFLDGDCELDPSFPETALDSFLADNTLGIVVGRCREKFPHASVYNLICDMEWRGPVGEIHACGGIFMIRRAAFDKAGQFDASIIAAEDDDLCLRVREQGFRIIRIDAEMCVHDAAMMRFWQWWRRSVRAGYAFAQLGERHRNYFRRERLRAYIWALMLPLAILLLAPATGGWSLLGLALYPASYFRTRRALICAGTKRAHASLYAAFLMLSKAPNLLGMLKFQRDRISGRSGLIIEHK